MASILAGNRVERTVEVICQRGCAYVRQVIVTLESTAVAQVEEIRDADDAAAVLVELKEIMSVYDESGGACCPIPRQREYAPDIKKASL